MPCFRVSKRKGIVIRCDHDLRIRETVMELVKQIAFQDVFDPSLTKETDDKKEDEDEKEDDKKKKARRKKDEKARRKKQLMREKKKRKLAIGDLKIVLWDQIRTAFWPGPTTDCDVIMNPLLKGIKIEFHTERLKAAYCK